MSGKFWRIDTIVFLGIWLALMTAGRSALIWDPGTYWHTVVGQRLLASGEWPHTDSFSATCVGQPWIAQQWLGEVVMALLYRMSGFDAQLLAASTMLAALFAWVAHRQVRGGLHPGLSVLLTGLALCASAGHFLVRPHLVTMAAMGMTLALLCDVEAGRKDVRQLLWLVPLMAIWSNIHGGALGGLLTLALVATGWMAERGLARLFGWGDLPPPTQRPGLLGLVLFAGGLATLLNPYGAETPITWCQLMASPVVAQVISEHRPLLNFPNSCWTTLLFGGVYLAVLAGIWPQRPRVTWLVPLVWLYLAWTRMRHGPLFAITAVIALADLLPRVRWVIWLSGKGSVLFRLRTVEPVATAARWNWRPAAFPAVVVLVTALLQATAIPLPILGRGWVQMDPTHWPVDLLPELQRYARSHPDGTPIFNDMLFGGFLIYHTPELRVFIDDRCELYGDEWLLAYTQALREDPAQFDRWARQYGFELALVSPESAFDAYLSRAAGWELQARSPAAMLYRRR